MDREYSLHPDKITVLKNQTLLKACETHDRNLSVTYHDCCPFQRNEGWALIQGMGAYSMAALI